ncbi:MAG: exonuclease [Planctomycetota bacterium]
MAKPEIYVSTDVEADGPIPGPHSMLSFASAAFTGEGTLEGTFSANLLTLPDASPDPATQAWWEGQPEAWAACRETPEPPEGAMRRYLSWLRGLPGKPVFVGYPATYDFMFVYWYLVRFTGERPFSHAGLDLKSYACALLGGDFRATSKRSMPRRWFSKRPHTHVALDDALEQGELFVAMLRERRER